MSAPAKAPKKVGRNARNLRAILLLVLLAGGLALLNAYTTRRDVDLATGPANDAQKQFFVAAADRPDIETFYKNLTHEQRVRMAERIGEHRHPKIVELTGKLLNSFDAQARDALKASLKKLATAETEAVADLLKLGSSFQRLAVFETLDTLGDQAVGLAVARMDKGDCRTNAGTYLLTKGNAPIQPLLALLRSTRERETRLAIADFMGKARAQDAAAHLEEWVEKAKVWTPDPPPPPADEVKEAQAKRDESNAHLAAVASIGNPRSEPLLLRSVDDPSLPGPTRAQCLLGLGRIGSPAAISRLWKETDSLDKLLARSAIGGLQIAGDKGLDESRPLPQLLAVAAGVRTPKSDAILRRGLASPLVLQAAEGCADRPALAPDLAAALRRTNAAEQGSTADALIRALSTTERGRRELAALRTDPAIDALAFRRLGS